MKKMILVLMLGAMVGAMMAGCSGGEKKPEEPAASNDASATPKEGQ